MNILLNGICGHMGREVVKLCADGYRSIELAMGVDPNSDGSESVAVYSSFSEIPSAAQVDCIVDFSHHSCIGALLDFAVTNGIPTVVATTGHTEDELEAIRSAAQRIPVFFSANMSLGVNVLISAVKHVAKSLYGFDIEIIEKHHNKKVDSPSGTALMLADAVKSELPEKYYVYGREGIVGARDKNEVGIHAIRGGNIVGEHQVIFAGENETLTFTHQATDRGVFAIGAVNAAIYICGKNAGIYNMDNLIKG